MITYICTAACADRLRELNPPDMARLIVLEPLSPWLSQLNPVPEVDEEVRVVVDPSWSDEEKQRFTLDIMGHIENLRISKHTHGVMCGQWDENAFWNYESSMHGPLLRDCINHNETALVVASGTSAKDFNEARDILEREYGDITTIAAWSVFKKYRYMVDYICHCDQASFDNAEGPSPTQGIVYTPSCGPGFLKQYEGCYQYVYLDASVPACARFAEARGVPEDPSIFGTVSDMAILVARVLGHKRICVLGLDLCFPDIEEWCRYTEISDELQEKNLDIRENYLGETVYSFPVFEMYKKGIEEHPRRWPEIQFFNMSAQGQVLAGFPVYNKG